jgi:colicin import membrane protein
MSAPNPPRQAAGSAGRLQAVSLSIVFHAAVVGFLGWGYWRYRSPKPAPQQLAIEATIVIDKSMMPTPAPATSAAPAQPAPAPVPEPAPPPPQPDTKAQQQREQQQREQREHEEQQRADDERAEHERVLREQREQREQAEAEQRHREQEDAAQKAAAHKAAEAAQAAQAAKDKARRESELRAQLAQEERINTARGSAAATEWLSLIRDRVTQRWIRPASARAGLNCEVRVTQVPGGEVTHVEIGSCNGDAAVRESIEAAVMRASPLPSPSNPDVFDRNLRFNFVPMSEQ